MFKWPGISKSKWKHLICLKNEELVQDYLYGVDWKYLQMAVELCSYWRIEIENKGALKVNFRSIFWKWNIWIAKHPFEIFVEQNTEILARLPMKRSFFCPSLRQIFIRSYWITWSGVVDISTAICFWQFLYQTNRFIISMKLYWKLFISTFMNHVKKHM